MASLGGVRTRDKQAAGEEASREEDSRAVGEGTRDKQVDEEDSRAVGEDSRGNQAAEEGNRDNQWGVEDSQTFFCFAYDWIG